jgi:hypothetical protein
LDESRAEGFLEMILRIRRSVPGALALYLFLGSMFVHPHATQAQAPSHFDGPAELPRIQVRSAMADTPATGRVRLIKEGENLQDALDEAKCGDTLRLQAGAVFRGLFRFPAKPCDDAHWIIVRTSAPDDSLPREGVRLTPCYAGVSSLPGRPDFHCSSIRNLMARVELSVKNDSGPILFLDGANHYRLVGLEITRGMPELHTHNLVQLRDSQNETAHHLVLDRLWLHGTAHDESKTGVHLSGMTHVAVVDSFFSDFHCIAIKGSCTDAQAISGGTGRSPGGPYKIENNFLEASGQSIMLGGGGGTTIPTDVEIRRNYLFKPLIWKPDEPGFVGGYTGNPFIVKNNFELKNAQRVLFEDNILENCWGGFSQTGFSIVLTPANQGGHCPQCRVTDVTIRYSRVSNVGSAILIATATGNREQPQISSGGERFSIHDLVVTDIKGKAYKGFGVFAAIISSNPPLKDVRIDHVTAFSPIAALIIMNRSDKLSGISITNSILNAGERGMFGAGGGAENCTSRTDNDPASILHACFANPVFSHNLILAGQRRWPEGNMVVRDAAAAGLWKSADGSEYRVCHEKGESPSCKKSSIAAGAASEGKDVGADIDAIEKATAGVI